MKIAFVMPYYSDRDDSPETVLERYPLTSQLPTELSKRGHPVRVLLHSPFRETLHHGDVAFEFIPPDPVLDATGRLLNYWKPRYGPAYYQPNWRLALRLRRLRPDIIHFSGLTLDLQLALVASVAHRLGSPLFVQFHGGVPDGSPRILALQGWNYRRVHRALFTSLEHARPWFEAGVLSGPEQAEQFTETSSVFSGIEKERARERTGMVGDPVFLSAGRLHPIKDPLTILRGFQRIVARLPEARLYCYYLTDELLPEIRQYLASDPQLAAQVELRGRAPLSEMEAVFSSADFLLQASIREWSGIAILDAMATGCIPIITDIPSFVEMTEHGRYGRHFAIGDDAGLASAVLALDVSSRERLSDKVQVHFRERLSFAALASQLESYYHLALTGEAGRG